VIQEKAFDLEIRTVISETFQKAVVKEYLTVNQAAHHLGIPYHYLSKVYGNSPKYLMKVPSKVWERLEIWVNKGHSIRSTVYPELPKKGYIKGKEINLPPSQTLTNLDDIIDKVVSGIQMAQKYEIPPTKWKDFLKDFVLNHQKQ